MCTTMEKNIPHNQGLLITLCSERLNAQTVN